MWNRPWFDPSRFQPSLPAKQLYETLAATLAAATAQARADEHLAVYFDTPAGERLTVRSVGYQGADLIVIAGKDRWGAACQVLAHVQTVQLILKYEPAAATPPPVGLLGDRLVTRPDEEQGDGPGS